VAFVIFLLVARLLSFVAGVARSRSIEADERRGEADLAAALARVLGRSDGLRSALPGASGCVAQALGLSAAAIELGSAVGGERRAAFPVRDGGTPMGWALLVPVGLAQMTERRVRERVRASVQAGLRVAHEREGMGSAGER
jgi:hypothetical protein